MNRNCKNSKVKKWVYEIDIDQDFEKEMNRTKTRVKTGLINFNVNQNTVKRDKSKEIFL